MVKNFIREWKLKNPKNRAFMLLGALFLACAIVGVFIPVIPQVPFAIIAAYFFSKGSIRIHMMIRYNKYFGKPVRDWEDHHVVRPKMKIFSTIAMIGGAAFAYFKLDDPMNLIAPALMIVAMIFILTRKSKPYKLLPL